MPKFSVIVPVYNVEEYLDRCISSIVGQTFSDFELILIDDGSVDKSGEICDSYAKEDCRIKVHHKSNSGVSAARNDGLELATGEYIVFIDSDDYVDKEYLQSFSSMDSDVVICGFNRCCEDMILKEEFDVESGQKSITKEILLEFMEHKLFFTVWGKAIRSNVINGDSKITFRSDMCYGEDTVFMMSVAERCHNITVLKECMYNYNKHSGETLTKKLTEKSLYSYFRFEEFVGNWLEKNQIDSSFYETLAFPSKSRISWAFNVVFNDKEKKQKDKRKWYRIFYKEKIFFEKIDLLLPNFSPKMRGIIKTGCPMLLSIAQTISGLKNR